jgi:hypothetical protein
MDDFVSTWRPTDACNCEANIEAAMPVILWLLGEPFVIVITVLGTHPI